MTGRAPHGQPRQSRRWPRHRPRGHRCRSSRSNGFRARHSRRRRRWHTVAVSRQQGERSAPRHAFRTTAVGIQDQVKGTKVGKGSGDESNRRTARLPPASLGVGAGARRTGAGGRRGAPRRRDPRRGPRALPKGARAGAGVEAESPGAPPRRAVESHPAGRPRPQQSSENVRPVPYTSRQDESSKPERSPRRPQPRCRSPRPTSSASRRNEPASIRPLTRRWGRTRSGPW